MATTPLTLRRTPSRNFVDAMMMSSPPLQSTKVAAAKELNNFLLQMDEQLRAQREASEFHSSGPYYNQVASAMPVPDEISMMERSTIALRPLRNSILPALVTKERLCPSCARRSMETPTRGRSNEGESFCTCDELNNISCESSSYRDAMMTPENFRTTRRLPHFNFEETTPSIPEVPTIIPSENMRSEHCDDDSPRPAPFLAMDCDDEEEEDINSACRIQLLPKVQRVSRSSSPQSLTEDASDDFALTVDLPSVPQLPPITTPNEPNRNVSLIARTTCFTTTPRTPAAF